MSECYIHSEAPAEARCEDCGRSLCAPCVQKVRDEAPELPILCVPCSRERRILRELAPGAALRPAYSTGHVEAGRAAASARQAPLGRSKLAAFFLSFCPGLGHWYLGLEVRGLYFIVSFFGLIAGAALLHAGLLGLVLAPLWLYSISDAMWAADELRLGIQPTDGPPRVFQLIAAPKGANRRLLAWSLIITGVLSLLSNLPYGLIPEQVERWIRGNLFGALLTGVGAWMLLRRRSRVEEDGGVE